jgi:hypothetical protein
MNDRQPSTPPVPADGLDARGRFAKGNKLGRGNPLAGRAAKIRADLLRATTLEDRQIIARKLIDGARSGDLAFIREFYDRTGGRPAVGIELKTSEVAPIVEYDLSILSESELVQLVALRSKLLTTEGSHEIQR